MATGRLDHEYYAYLASRIRQGDNDAFAELYDATYGLLHRYCLYFLKDPQMVPDAMQDIYIAIFRGIPSLKIDSMLYSWMKQVAYHTCCNILRQVRRSREYSTDLQDEAQVAFLADSLSHDCFQPVYDSDTMREFSQALDTLPLKCRQAFLLRYENELKLEEIADFMGTSLSSVKRYIATARTDLQQKMSHIKTKA